MQIPREVYHWHTVTLEYKACRWDEAYLSMLLFLHVPPFFYPTISQKESDYSTIRRRQTRGCAIDRGRGTFDKLINRSGETACLILHVLKPSPSSVIASILSIFKFNMSQPNITLYTTQTPNGIKISIALEELGYGDTLDLPSTKANKSVVCHTRSRKSTSRRTHKRKSTCSHT